jgi:hypothetical protein
MKYLWFGFGGKAKIMRLYDLLGTAVVIERVGKMWSEFRVVGEGVGVELIGGVGSGSGIVGSMTTGSLTGAKVIKPCMAKI